MTLGRPQHFKITNARDNTANQYVRVEPAGRIFVVTESLTAEPIKTWALDTKYETLQKAEAYALNVLSYPNVERITESEFVVKVRELREATAKIPLW